MVQKGRLLDVKVGIAEANAARRPSVVGVRVMRERIVLTFHSQKIRQVIRPLRASYVHKLSCATRQRGLQEAGTSVVRGKAARTNFIPAQL